MRLRALAKINLGLDILRKREDGYHEVRMIMQTIQMYDVLEMKRVRKPGISLSVNYSYIPNDERNLVYKAAKLLMDEFQVKGGVDIHLEKFIPVAAGMAGGSSDAAAALVGINRLFKLGLSQKELMDRAVNIGADVPYCVMRGTALAEGIGEKLTRITQVPDSPKSLIPISRTAISSPSRRRKTVRGRPSSLLKLPCVFRVWYFWFRTDAITSFVLVLPTLPVIPTTGI